MEDLFTDTYSLDGKIRLSVAGVPEDWRKKWFPLAGISHFSKIGFLKNSPNKRMLFQVDRRSVSTCKNEEFVLEYVSTRRKNSLHWQKYLKNLRKSLPIAVISFK